MSNKEVLRRVFSYVGRYKIYLLLSVLFSLVSVAGTLYVPVLIGKAIDCIVGVHQVDFSGVALRLLQIGVIIAVAALAQWLMNACNNKITFNVVRDMRARAFCKIERLPISYLDADPSGEIV